MSGEAGVRSAESRKRRLMIAVLILAVVGVLARVVLGPREPSYNGKKLSEWLNDPNRQIWRGDTDSPEATALREMGTNAVPFLVRIIQGKSSPFEPMLVALSKKQSVIKFEYPEFWERQYAACMALYTIGPKAKSTIPVLTNLLWRTNAHGGLAIALAGMGPEGITPLLEALTNQSADIRFNAVLGLQSATTELEIVVPALIQRLSDNDKDVRYSTAHSLGTLHAMPELVVPALIQSLSRKDKSFQMAVFSALGVYGGQAKEAVPKLAKLLQNPDPDLGEYVTNALKQIDPEAAAKAGVK